MHFSNVNLLSVLAAGIATMILGFVWYSPALFAKPWMREMGYDLNDKAKLKEMQKSAGPTYGIAFLAGLVSAFMLGKILSITPIDTDLYGMKHHLLPRRRHPRKRHRKESRSTPCLPTAIKRRAISPGFIFASR